MTLEHIIKAAIDSLPPEEDVRIRIERSTAKFAVSTPLAPQESIPAVEDLSVEVSDKLEIKGN